MRRAAGALLLALPLAALAMNESGPGGSFTVPEKSKVQQPEPVSQEARGEINSYLGRLPPGLEEKFWGRFSGAPPQEQSRAAEALLSFLKGGGGFERFLLASGMDPGALNVLLGELRPFMFEPGGRGQPFKPYGGPPPRFWRELRSRHPGRPEPWAGSGADEFGRGDFLGSAKSYDTAIGLGGQTAENYLGRGLALDRLGDFSQAHQDAATALSMDPGNPNAEALYRLTEGRPSTVKLNLNAGGLTVTPGDAAAVPGGTGGAAAGPGARGAPPAATAPMSSPAQLSAHFTRLASAALQVGDLRAAASAATRALAHDPANPVALNLRAMARERSGDRRGAAEDASLGLAAAPRNVPLLNTRAWAFSGLRRFADALADASLASTLAPENGYAYLNLARAQGGLGRRDEMLATLRRAAHADPRLRAALESALQLPADKDTELLFAGGFPAGGPAAPRASRGRRFAVVLVSSLVGGALVALGLLHILSPAWRERVTTTWRGRAGPARARRGPPASAVEGPPSGRFWEHYEYKRVVASGGMGIVYEAFDKSLGRRVAVKKMRGEIRDDPREREQFLKEARLVAGLRHPGIVEIHAIVDEGPDLYLVFEFVEGRTLQAALQEKGRLTLAEAAPVLRGVCAALQHAHEQGVIHRDLKPSNIMVTPGGEAKVMDFGVARQSRDPQKLTLTTTIAGTPPYMSPEAEQGVLCRESDVFSLGVCLYEMLTGKPAFEGPPGTMMLNKLAAKYEPASMRAPGLSPAVDAMLARALSPQPANRFPGPALLYAELARLAGRP